MEIIKPPYSSAAQALEAATRLVGGRKVLADMLEVSVAAVGNWKVRGVPIEHCVAIERATNGQVTRQDLRPNDWQKYWPELAQVPTTIAQDATETVLTEADGLRTGVARRHSVRMAKGVPVDGDRRAKGGPPFQAPVVGVA